MAARSKTGAKPPAEATGEVASTGPPRYHGATSVARTLGVHPGTIPIWRDRFKNTRHPFPEPDVEILGGRKLVTPGWSDESLKKILEWSKHKAGVRPRGRPTGSTTSSATT
jgi:hypothetical protein